MGEDLDKEAAELGELIDVHEKIVEHVSATPYRPNRAQRRAMAKRDRKKRKNGTP